MQRRRTMDNLKRLKLYLLDMDGTIYLDNDLFDGTAGFLEYVKSMGGRYIFLTNNSSKSVSKYCKLKSCGQAEMQNFFCNIGCYMQRGAVKSVCFVTTRKIYEHQKSRYVFFTLRQSF